MTLLIEKWEMHHSKEWCTSNEIPRYSAKKPPMTWECSSECKILSDSDVCTIIDLDIVFASGAWIKKKMNKAIGTLLPKKELIQVE